MPPSPSHLPGGVRVLVAGIDREARGPIEAAIRRVFASRPPEELWAVSLVRLPSQWSVTLNGPGETFRSLSFTAEEQDLARAIRDAIGGEAARPGPLPEADRPSGGPVEDRHACARCGGAMRVLYEARPDEPKDRVPVACPHCWAVNHVAIGTWAAVGGDYRAEKA